MASIAITNKTSSSITLYISGLGGGWTTADGNRRCEWYWSKTNSSPSPTGYLGHATATIYGVPSDGTGGHINLTELTPNTLYYCSCYIYNDGGALLTSIVSEFTTSSDPYIVVSAVTSNSCSLHLAGLDEGWDGGNRTCTWCIGEGETPTMADYFIRQDGDVMGNYISQGGYTNINGLNADSLYYVGCYVFDSDGMLLNVIYFDINGTYCTFSTQSGGVWTLITSDIGRISEQYTTTLSLNGYKMYRFMASFSQSSIVKVEGVGVSTLVYVTTDEKWNTAEGYPVNYITNNNDLIRFAAESDKTYYVWVRPFDPEYDIGTVNIAITSNITEWTVTEHTITFSDLNPQTVTVPITPGVVQRVLFSAPSAVGSFEVSAISNTVCSFFMSDTVRYVEPNTGTPRYYDFSSVGTTFYKECPRGYTKSCVVYVRGDSFYNEGFVSITVTPPSGEYKIIENDLGELRTNRVEILSNMENYTTICTSVRFPQSGYVTFNAVLASADGVSYPLDTSAFYRDYLSSTTSFDYTNGIPTSYITYSQAYGSTSSGYTKSPITHMVEAGVTYYFWGRIVETETDTDSAIISITFTDNPNPEQWEWIGVAPGLYVDEVPHTHWNGFVERIADWLAYKRWSNTIIGEPKYGYSSNTTYAVLLNAAKMSNTVEDRTLTANRFNIARYVLGSISTDGTGLNDFSSEVDGVKASYLHTLADVMNNDIK